MRRWGILAVLLGSMGSTAAADNASDAEAMRGLVDRETRLGHEDESGPVPRVGYSALPGGLHVASAEALPTHSVALSLISGLGYRKGLLSADHSYTRAIGQIAAAYAPLRDLMVGLSLDGRRDSHKDYQGKSDDNYVGDPHLLARYAAPVGRVRLGGQLNLWVPGKDAPSVAASAISVDARALLSIDAGFGTLAVNAGFRLDNSDKSIDDPEALSVEDQVSLGTSKFHAVLGGASLTVPLGRAYASLEGSTDVFVGDGAPSPIVRGGVQLGAAINDTFRVVGYLAVATSDGIRSEALMGEIPMIPYEPQVTGGLGLQAVFGRASHPPSAPSAQITRNERPAVIPVIETADLSGIVFDDAGKPVVGAVVTVKLKNHTATAVTDARGAYAIAKLPIGKTIDGKTELDDTIAEVSSEVANKKLSTVTVTLTKGANAAPPLTLESALPPGQLRAVIISVGNSRPVAGATVTIEPGGVTATSGADGKFTVDLPPGQYKLTVTARGLAQQTLDVNIEQNGVAIKNIELHK